MLLTPCVSHAIHKCGHVHMTNGLKHMLNLFTNMVAGSFLTSPLLKMSLLPDALLINPTPELILVPTADCTAFFFRKWFMLEPNATCVAASFPLD